MAYGGFHSNAPTPAIIPANTPASVITFTSSAPAPPLALGLAAGDVLAGRVLAGEVLDPLGLREETAVGVPKDELEPEGAPLSVLVVNHRLVNMPPSHENVRVAQVATWRALAAATSAAVQLAWRQARAWSWNAVDVQTQAMSVLFIQTRMRGNYEQVVVTTYTPSQPAPVAAVLVQANTHGEMPFVDVGTAAVEVSDSVWA
ncbi:hypothetical protein BU17DRAFT_67299 [Hysterangium stoloniferum]|nr:hypothetical protein BU17DRAFT_67299 [Hysterangium stoloniferum]